MWYDYYIAEPQAGFRVSRSDPSPGFIRLAGLPRGSGGRTWQAGRLDVPGDGASYLDSDLRMVSDMPRDSSPSQGSPDEGFNVLPLLSIRDLYADEGEADWLVQDYLVVGDKTVISARPKTGKSTLAFAWSTALLRGVDSFLGKSIGGGNIGVVYCTEEVSKRGLRDKARQFNLGSEDSFLVLRRTDVADETWPGVVKKLQEDTAALKEQWAVDRMLVVIDGFGKWAGFVESQENDASVTRRALEELDVLLRDEHTVLVLHHAGWQNDRERGSTGIAGEAGIRLFLAGEGPEPRTLKHKGGRHGDPCADLTYRLTDKGFESLGSMPTKMATGLSDALAIIDELGTPTTQEIVDRMPVAYNTTLGRLRKLEAIRKVEHFDEGRGAEHRRRWKRLSEMELLFRAGTFGTSEQGTS